MLRVIVTVSGGVAEVAECPPGVEVEVRDYDNGEGASDEEREEYEAKQDAYGNWYCPVIYGGVVALLLLVPSVLIGGAL